MKTKGSKTGMKSIIKCHDQLKTTTMELIFKVGQVVYERTRPTQRLIVKRIASNLYYCQPEESGIARQLVYKEGDLGPAPTVKSRNNAESIFSRLKVLLNLGQFIYQAKRSSLS